MRFLIGHQRTGAPQRASSGGWKKPWSALHAGAMVAGWKFLGEFKRGRRKSLSLECIVALRDRNEAERIARKKLVGADKITAVELSWAELRALNMNEGDVRLSE
jgi:hypothetical protein